MLFSPYFSVPKRNTVAALGDSGGVPVTVLRVFEPSVTSNVHCPCGTGPQLLPREYFTPCVWQEHSSSSSPRSL